VEIREGWKIFHLFFSSVFKMVMSRMRTTDSTWKSHGKRKPFEVGQVTGIKKEATRVLPGLWRLGEIHVVVLNAFHAIIFYSETFLRKST
jgi:hypothetical protein